MRTYTIVLHQDGPALWPDHLPLADVLKLRATTPELVWEGTYQGNPTPAGGYVFRRDWWQDKRRYMPNTWAGKVVARYQSWDFAEKDKETNDYSVCITADILADYRMLIRHVYRDRITFDVVPQTVIAMARQWNRDGLLRNVIVEDKSSGTPAYQTVKAIAEPWLKSILIAYQPIGGKIERANAASVWCANGMVWLPYPDASMPWLIDLEDELFSFPQATHDDQADALSQVIIFCEHILSSGYAAKGAIG